MGKAHPLQEEFSCCAHTYLIGSPGLQTKSRKFLDIRKTLASRFVQVLILLDLFEYPWLYKRASCKHHRVYLRVPKMLVIINVRIAVSIAEKVYPTILTRGLCPRVWLLRCIGNPVA